MAWPRCTTAISTRAWAKRNDCTARSTRDVASAAASTQGSGIFGQWIVDEFGLPAYDYTFDQIADERAVRVELNNTRDHMAMHLERGRALLEGKAPR